MANVSGLTAEHLDQQLTEMAAHLGVAFSVGQTLMRQETLTLVWEQTPATTNCLVATVTAEGIRYPNHDCFVAWILCLREIHGERTPIKAWLRLCPMGEIILYLLEPEHEYNIYVELASLFWNCIHSAEKSEIEIRGLLPDEQLYIWSQLSVPRIAAQEGVMPLLVTVAQFAMRGHARWVQETQQRRGITDEALPEVPVADVADMVSEVSVVLAKNIFNADAAATVLMGVYRWLNNSIAYAHLAANIIGRPIKGTLTLE